MKKLFYLSLILLIFSSCARQKLKKIIDSYGEQTLFVYTDDLAKTQNIFNNDKIFISNLPEKESFILPNSMIVLWHTTHIPDIKFLKREFKGKPVVYRFNAQALNNREFIDYFLAHNSIVKIIYTDSTEFFTGKTSYHSYKIKTIDEADPQKIISGKALAIIFKQNIEFGDLKAFTNGQVKIISNIYGLKAKILEDINKYRNILNFDTIFTNNPELLREIMDSTIYITALNDTTTRIIDSVINLIDCSRAIFIQFKYPRNIQITNKKIIHKLNSLQVIDKDFIQFYLPDQNLFLLKKGKKLVLKYHPQIIYTNRPKFVSHLFDSLTVQYRNFPLTKAQNKKDTIPFLQKIKIISDQTQNGISLVFYLSANKDSLKLLSKLYKSYFKNSVITEATTGTIIFSKYLADTVFVNEFKTLLSKYNFQYIISTKPSLARILTQNNPTFRYQGFPTLINIQTGEKNKYYNNKISKLKKLINKGEAIILIHQDKTDSLREQYEKLVSHFIAPVYFIKTTSTTAIIYSRYLEKKAKILQLIDTNYQIFTNKPAILQYIYTLPKQKISPIPNRCIPPSCATNTQFEPQMNELRRKIIIKNAQVVYFIDPTDSIYPNEKQIRNQFRFFKFTKFDGGYVIKNYEGD